ncbi:MAG: MBL fold metallo-hydrolase [Hyphomicrobiaceae bacterium]|nr:MBL fold metallo-hydrolase [Hyphomicrobiaceae bacterium]
MSAQTAKCIAPTGAKRTRFRETPMYEEGLWDLGNGLYAWMVPNGSWGESNAGLVTGDGESLLIDTLWDLRYTQSMLDAMAPVFRRAPLTTLVNTHADGDHFWGNQLVDDHVVSITSEAARTEMDLHKPSSMLAFGRLGATLQAVPFKKVSKVGHWFSAMCLPYEFDEVIHTPATTTFSGSEWREVGGRRLQLIEVGPAHTTGDLMVYVPDARTLFAGDILFVGSTPVMWAGPVENWLTALDLILDLDAETIVPGHGPVTDKSGVRTVKAYWEYTGGAARTLFDRGIPEQEAAHRILQSADFRKQPFADWDSPERMMTNVHVLFRHFKGKTGHMSVPAKVNMMRKQAILANAFPDAKPTMMRLEDASL